MAARGDQRRIAGLSVGGIIVIVGLLAIVFWSFGSGWSSFWSDWSPSAVSYGASGTEQAAQPVRGEPLRA
jgi:hypothetical protein